jgi:hypothetical protein
MKRRDVLATALAGAFASLPMSRAPASPRPDIGTRILAVTLDAGPDFVFAHGDMA